MLGERFSGIDAIKLITPSFAKSGHHDHLVPRHHKDVTATWEGLSILNNALVLYFIVMLLFESIVAMALALRSLAAPLAVGHGTLTVTAGSGADGGLVNALCEAQDEQPDGSNKVFDPCRAALPIIPAVDYEPAIDYESAESPKIKRQLLEARLNSPSSRPHKDTIDDVATPMFGNRFPIREVEGSVLDYQFPVIFLDLEQRRIRTELGDTSVGLLKRENYLYHQLQPLTDRIRSRLEGVRTAVSGLSSPIALNGKRRSLKARLDSPVLQSHVDAIKQVGDEVSGPASIKYIDPLRAFVDSLKDQLAGPAADVGTLSS
jgi:hypothetical protein